jgi:hypothetical protein
MLVMVNFWTVKLIVLFMIHIFLLLIPILVILVKKDTNTISTLILVHQDVELTAYSLVMMRIMKLIALDMAVNVDNFTFQDGIMMINNVISIVVLMLTWLDLINTFVNVLSVGLFIKTYHQYHV